MGLYSFILLASIYASASFGGTLEVIDYNGQCLVYSAGNYGCTGYSAPFGLLNGSDCSEISEVTNGTRHDYPVLKVDTCGEINDQQTAWIKVNQTGLVTFSNRNGEESSCILENGLKVGSACHASDFHSFLSTSSTATATTSKSSTSSISSTSSSSSTSFTSSTSSAPSRFSLSTPIQPSSSSLLSTCSCSVA